MGLRSNGFVPFLRFFILAVLVSFALVFGFSFFYEMLWNFFFKKNVVMHILNFFVVDDIVYYRLWASFSYLLLYEAWLETL